MAKLQVHRSRTISSDPVIAVLVQARLAKNWRLSDLAKRVGYNRQLISEWEQGHRFPNYRSLLNWCEALHVQLTAHVMD